MLGPLIGQRVRALRLQRGLTQRQLAHTLAVSLNSLTMLERGLIPDPRVGRVVALAETLGVPPDMLLGRMPLEEPHAL
jgi:transcriptional regulator with XRE-family HTH domain